MLHVTCLVVVSPEHASCSNSPVGYDFGVTSPALLCVTKAQLPDHRITLDCTSGSQTVICHFLTMIA